MSGQRCCNLSTSMLRFLNPAAVFSWHWCCNLSTLPLLFFTSVTAISIEMLLQSLNYDAAISRQMLLQFLDSATSASQLVSPPCLGNMHCYCNLLYFDTKSVLLYFLMSMKSGVLYIYSHWKCNFLTQKTSAAYIIECSKSSGFFLVNCDNSCKEKLCRVSNDDSWPSRFLAICHDCLQYSILLK